MSHFEPDGPYHQYEGGATFVRVCPKCNRFAKADEYVLVNEETGLKPGPTGTCSKHGRIEMPFVGFM